MRVTKLPLFFAGLFIVLLGFAAWNTQAQIAERQTDRPAAADDAPANSDTPAAEKNIVITRDVVYGKAGGEELQLNLAYDANLKTPRPCVVVIHGGAWRSGNRGGLHDLFIEGLARRGYVAASISYRLVPKHIFPAQIEDAKCAVRYLRAHADKYNIDTERFGAMGFSAGGHLSMLLGAMNAEDGMEGDGGWPKQSSKVQAVVSFFGPTDLGAADIPELSKPLLRDFVGGTPQEVPQQVKAASPVTYIDPTDPPMLLYQGTKDRLVPGTQAWVMAQRMTEAGVDGRVELIIGADHGWLNWESPRTLEQMHKFFDHHLKN